jgi:exodeoxyribonuclease VII small subunit
VKKPNFEASLKELEEIVEQLEKGDLKLDETLAKYEMGIKIYKKCYQILESAEKKINVLLKNTAGETYTKEFNLEKTRDVNSLTSENKKNNKAKIHNEQLKLICEEGKDWPGSCWKKSIARKICNN